MPGDETIAEMGGRVLRVMRRLALEHAGEPAALISHADPLNAAWIVLDQRAQNEAEMHHKGIDKAGMLRVEMEGETAKSWEYIKPPHVAKPTTAAA